MTAHARAAFLAALIAARSGAAPDPVDPVDAALRLCVPEVRDGSPVDPIERELAAISELAHAGRFSASLAALDRFDASRHPPLALHLSWILRRCILDTQIRYVDGGIALGADAELRATKEYFLEIQRWRDEEGRRRRMLGADFQARALSAAELAANLTVCRDGPPIIRSLQGLPSVGDAEQSFAAACRENVRSALHDRSTPGLQRFAAWHEVAVHSSMGRRAEADAVLRRLAVEAPPAASCLRARVLLARAELFASPAGNVSTLGSSILSAHYANSRLNRGESAPEAPVSPADRAEARLRYSAAAAEVERCGSIALDVRRQSGRAQLARLDGDEPDAGAILRAAAKRAGAAGLVRDAAVAAAGAALLLLDRDALRKAMRQAVEEGDLGAGWTIAEMGILRATRLGYERERPDQGIPLLESLMEEAVRLGLPGTANDIRNSLRFLYGNVGRVEASVYLEEEAVRVERSLADKEMALDAEIAAARPPLRSRDGHRHMYGTRLESLLGLLVTDLSVLAAKEGDEEWIQRRDRATAELQVLRGALSPALRPEADTPFVRLRFLGDLKAALRLTEDCAGQCEVLATYDARASTMSDVPPLLDTLGSECDSSRRARVEAFLRQAPASPALSAAVARTRQCPVDPSVCRLEAKVAWDQFQSHLAMAARIRSSGALEALVSAGEKALGADAGMPPYAGPLELARAMADLEAGHSRESMERLRHLVAAPDLDRMDHVLVLHALVDAAASVDPLTALWAREQGRAERILLQGYRTGVLAASPETAELAALERGFALAGELSPPEHARLLALRKSSAGNTRVVIARPSRQAIAELLHRLPPRTVMLAYEVGPSSAIAWRAERGAPLAAFQIAGTSDELLRLCGRLRALLAEDADPTMAEPLAAELASRLLAPAGVLPAGATVVIVAPPTLSIPFELLPAGGGSTLGEDHQVLYTERLWEQEPSGPLPAGARLNAVIAVNGPFLQHAESEGVEVARVLKVEPILGARATGPVVGEVLAQATHIHLATHAALDERNPLASWLALKDGAPFPAYSLFARIRHPELVVLSACNTRSTMAVAPTYAVSYSGLVHLAGARWVVSSLWPVDDESTGALMADFHRALETGHWVPGALKAATGAARLRPNARAFHYGPFMASARSLAAALATWPGAPRAPPGRRK